MSDHGSFEPVSTDQPASMPRFQPHYSLPWFNRQLGEAAVRPVVDASEPRAKEHSFLTVEQLLGTSTPLSDLRGKPKSSAQNKSPQNLDNIVRKSHEILAQAATVFPFTLFPDSVIVDRTKVTIIKRNFFWSEDVVSIRIEDVLNATCGVDLFFGSLNVSSRVMNSTDHYKIKFLKKRDAMHLKHLIQGYVIAQHNEISIAHLDRDKLIKTLCELGDDTR